MRPSSHNDGVLGRWACTQMAAQPRGSPPRFPSPPPPPPLLPLNPFACTLTSGGGAAQGCSRGPKRRGRMCCRACLGRLRPGGSRRTSRLPTAASGTVCAPVAVSTVSTPSARCRHRQHGQHAAHGLHMHQHRHIDIDIPHRHEHSHSHPQPHSHSRRSYVRD